MCGKLGILRLCSSSGKNILSLRVTCWNVYTLLCQFILIIKVFHFVTQTIKAYQGDNLKLLHRINLLMSREKFCCNRSICCNVMATVEKCEWILHTLPLKGDFYLAWRRIICHGCKVESKYFEGWCDTCFTTFEVGQRSEVFLTPTLKPHKK